jgi:hypothetical protein
MSVTKSQLSPLPPLSTVQSSFWDWLDGDHTPMLETTPVRYLDFSVDPLATIVAIREFMGWPVNHRYINQTIYGHLSGEAVCSDVPEVTERHRQAAEQIRTHFRNRFLIHAIRSDGLSVYRQHVMDLLESPLRIEADKLRILLRLPDHYREDQEMASLIANHQSAPEVSLGRQWVDSRWTHVGSVMRYARRDSCRVYLRDEENRLLCVNTQSDGDLTHQALRGLLERARDLPMRGDLIIRPETGYPGFRFFYLGGKHEWY